MERLDEFTRTLDTKATSSSSKWTAACTAPQDKLVVNLAERAASTRADIAPAARWAAIQVAELAGIAKHLPT